ncbi:MAG: alpha-ketoglutarate-dependent dioxygenase AlkB [Nocardioides sp.]
MDFQGTLLATGTGLADLADGLERRALSHGAWIDVRRNWVASADELFNSLLVEVAWRAERRPMYDRVVDVPRLVATYPAGAPLPHHLLVEAREALSRHYLPELGEPFVTAGCCYYRDGRDSVAWHGDTLGRGRTTDTMVAIVSLGDPRRLTCGPARAAAPCPSHSATATCS